MHISEMQSKIDKICFLLEIKAFEVIAGISAYCAREYLPSGVNVLTNSKKISGVTKENFSNSI